MSHSNLTGAVLILSNLTDAVLALTDLKDTRLFEANLTGTNLGGANLTGAKLDNANLTGALLYLANLTNTKMDGANLTGSDLLGANLENLMFLEEIAKLKLPDGSEYTTETELERFTSTDHPDFINTRNKINDIRVNLGYEPLGFDYEFPKMPFQDED